MKEKRLKVLEIIPALHCGGAERFVVDLANELAEHCEVELLCVVPVEEGDFLAGELRSEVTLSTLMESGETRLSQLRILYKIRSRIRQSAPDVVHLHLGTILLARLAIYTLSWPIRYFYTVHNDARLDAGRRISALRRLFRSGRVRPVTISPESERSFVAAYGFEAPVIENGCGAKMPGAAELAAVSAEVRSWRSTPTSRLLLNIARFSPQKNQIAQARAAAALAAEGADFDLVFMGNDADEEIRSAIQGLNCPRVHIAGLRSNPLAYLAQADYLSLFSEMEGLPITLLESFALGIPACVTPVGGMRDLVEDGVNGLVSADTSESSIRVTLERALALDTAERARLGEGARASFAPYSMERCAERYLRLFGQAGKTGE